VTPAYRTPTPADASALVALGRETFTATFGHLYPPEDLQTFLEEAHNPETIRTRLADPARRYRVAQAAGQMVGFCHLAPLKLPLHDQPAPALELSQLYVLPDWLGAGIGPALMDWALEQARGAGVRSLVLSVYSENYRAQRFYQRYGFEKYADYEFHVGRVVDAEYLMCKSFPPS